MAQEDFRNPHQPQFYDHLDHRMDYPPPPQYQPEAYRSKSRQTSRDRGDTRAPDPLRFSQPQQPINEAVTSAFDKADVSATLHPDLIAHITENVIKQLRTSVDSGTPLQANYPPPPPPQQPVPQSPSTQSGASPPMPTRNVYTPPSPHKTSAYNSPESSFTGPHASPPSPPREREPPIQQHYEENRPPSRVSISSQTSNTAGSQTGNARPKGPTRLSTSQEETTLEKIWGPLFQEEGRPTAKLSQLLRGLAVSLIEEYEPRNSIVVTPHKMARYYEEIHIPGDIYPWSAIFDDTESSISRMYRELECQHHLVQERNNEKPDIPGLTPLGFERWATLMIQAHPEEECERLKKALFTFPISNPDERKERFPKDISRRLFPATEDRQIRDRVQSAMIEHAGIKLPGRSSSDMPRPSQSEPAGRHYSEASGTEFHSTNIERERKPYTGVPTESAVDDTSDLPTPTPIERERKPYRAAPGGGRVYEEDGRATTIPASFHRSNSTAERSRPINISQAPRQPAEMPEVHHHHRGSTTSNLRRAGPPRGHSPSYSAGNNDFRRSSDDIRTYQSSNYIPPTSQPTDSHDDELRRHNTRESEMRRTEFARRQADEEAGLYGGSPSSRARYEPRADPRVDPRTERQYPADEDYYRQGRGYAKEYGTGHGGQEYRER